MGRQQPGGEPAPVVCDLGHGPPAHLVDAFGAQLLPRQLWCRIEAPGPHEVDLVPLAVPSAAEPSGRIPVFERDEVQPVPDVGADGGVQEAELLRELASQGRDRILVGLDATARQTPHRGGGELEAHQQDPVLRIEHQRPDGSADPQR